MNFPALSAACGKCCNEKDGEMEVKAPGKRIGAPFFQGPLEVADEKDNTPGPPRTAAPAVVELAEAADSRHSGDYSVPPPPLAGIQVFALSQQQTPGSGPDPRVTARDESRPTSAGSRRTFKTVINKGERKLGIDINHHDNVTLLVTKVNDGPVMEHNLSNPDEAILPGDRIVELNGIRGNTQYMLASCIGVTELHFAISTAPEWTTHIQSLAGDEADQKLGLVVQPIDMVSLVITKIEDGLAMEKAAREPEFDIRPEDRIVAINDARLDTAALIQELESATSWSITWRRIEMKDL